MKTAFARLTRQLAQAEEEPQTEISDKLEQIIINIETIFHTAISTVDAMSKVRTDIQ